MDACITAAALQKTLSAPRPAAVPLVIDVRRTEAFRRSGHMIKGALRRDPDRAEQWAATLPRGADIVVYCVHGEQVSQHVARTLGARYLEGGMDGWREAGGALARKPAGAATRWVTRERPKIDRIACPWLVRRFVDPDAEFLYVPAADVRRVAAEREAIPYDIPDVEFSHEGERCSFDAFLSAHRLSDPALEALALIVRAADTARLDLVPEAAGLAALSLGLSRNFKDDHQMLEQGMVMYDALYAWCREGKDEVHTWNPAAYR